MSSRLAQASSSYLKSAAHQPVDWHPWGPEAFERARQENKPVLLDIGAVWCHWCHVMDGESYEDPAIADILNRDWICVKVDRDERPDVDVRYQRAVQALTGQGGWPLTAFLTPTGDVFFGGTYFPPEDGGGRPGFATVLQELAGFYRTQPDRVAAQAAEIRKHVTERLVESRPGAVESDILIRASDVMARAFDFRYGGFGTQPKFPHPAACSFLLTRWFDTREPWLKEMVDRTLTGMARGGVYDHIGGGFHRYSVDARWIVPHFEKMSYDNSELLRAYVCAAGVYAGRTPAPGAPSAPGTKGQEGQWGQQEQLYLHTIRGILDWLRHHMSHHAGGYFASQDADVGPNDDGDYFTWTPDEVRAVTTPDEFAVLERYYDIDDDGEMHHNPRKNVLYLHQSVSAIAAGLGKPDSEVTGLLESGRNKLRIARLRRTAPFIDRTLYTGWNAMMASAALEAAALLDDTELEQHALRSLERIFREARDDGGGILHAIGGSHGAILEDQVQVASAALDAHEATGDSAWLARAEELAEHVWRAYRADDGGLYDRPRGHGGEGFLDQQIKPFHDAPTPSPNGVAAILLARLAEHTGDESWRARQRELIEAFAGGAAELSLHGATLLRGIDWSINPAAHVVIVGEPGDGRAVKLGRVARATFRPRKVVTLLRPGAEPRRLPKALQAMIDARGPRAYVCVGPQCAAPVDDPLALAETLATFGIQA